MFFRCAKTTCDIPATYIIYYICVVAFLKEISLLYKGDTEKQSPLYKGDTESGHNNTTNPIDESNIRIAE